MGKKLQLVEHASYWEIPIRGMAISRFIIDFTFLEIEVFEDFTLTFRFEGEFLFEAGGQERILTIADPPSLCPILTTLNHAIKLAQFSKEGVLEIHLEDDSKFIVKPRYMVEAWELHSSVGLRVVCVPGGGL
ncbi:MAG: DUF6188 family protein [Anaerolineae bacterium]|nr:DUF6188 family protein [Anaerolineae bacterium]